MERLQYLNILRKILWENLEDVVRPMTSSFIRMETALAEMPCVMIHGKSTLVSRSIARKHIAMLFNKEQTLYNSEKGTLVETEGISYLSFNDFLEIDIENVIQSTNDKMVLPEMLRQIAAQKAFSGKRHILLVHSIDSMNIITMHAMRKVFEGYSNNVYFIMTCRSLSKVTDEIKSRCIMISGWHDTLAISKMLIMKVRPDLIEHVETIHKRAEGDIVNVSILLELESPELFTGHLPFFIDKSLTGIFKCKNHGEREKKIRELCTAIAAACIPLPIIGLKLLEYVQLRLPDESEEIPIIIEMIADMEHKTMISNKSLFALEMFIHDFMNFLTPIMSSSSCG